MLDRRTFLLQIGAIATTAALDGPTVSIARTNGDRKTGGDRLHPRSDDWRRRIAPLYINQVTDLVVRPLQEGLELWEVAPVGYLVVDATTATVLEYSAATTSPFWSVGGGSLSYMGLGGWFAEEGSHYRNVLSDEHLDRAEARAIARDSADMIHETAEINVEVSALQQASTLDADGLADVSRVKASEVKMRVPSYSLITGCHVYPNTTNICGWVAGSILVRYWYARYTSRNLLPSNYRSGTNLSSSPNFATFLRGTSSNTSWALNVRDRLRWLIDEQNVNASAAYALGKIGIDGQLNTNKRPVILFGQLPKTTSTGKSAHAVVVYGLTTHNLYIAHYGYSGWNDVVINGGLAGSNTKFWYN